MIRKTPSDVNPYYAKIREYPDTILVPDDKGNIANFPVLSPQQPVIVEVGSGSGNHMLQFLQRQPQVQYFGFELRYKRLYRTAQKLERDGLNGYVVQCPAQYMHRYFAPNTVERIIINFPDPWPKLRTRKNRIMAPHNLAMFARCLCADGWLDFKSDHREYFLWAREHILDSSLKLEFSTLDLHNSPYAAENIITEFERLFMHKIPKTIGALRARKG
ncbi:tRNA (guanine(46)-N(7))-methyltransferase TrmB [Desulfurispira natronophila]|uniref:tRNA (guanine-N(7)-)-methyltransferase n=1 Tax=Desulfurispira natronophila TaxID=682562 RepID=A0A7W7Y3W1_9BACT|nr:hypothetical protein [Desulfurispira natronophila]MBB5021621.1 tRNA (guanine-N7-)-methyltransferase [Desulfurispira natronophila]